MSDDVLIVEQNGYVATFTINRPEKRNALNPEIHAQMVRHIDRLSEEGQTRCLIIKGQGGLAFSAGDDLKRAPGDRGPQPDPDKDPKLQWPHRKTVEAIFDAPFPVVAMIDGFCVGGGLALATECDMRICTDRAQLGIPPSRLGIIYDYGRPGRSGVHKRAFLLRPARHPSTSPRHGTREPSGQTGGPGVRGLHTGR